MAKTNDSNIWMISMTVIAIVAIVAVFGLVKMTGYSISSISGEVPAYTGGQSWSQSYKLEHELLITQMQTERELKQQYGDDIQIAWVKFIYGNKAMIGGIVLNADGSYNTDATEGLTTILGINAPNEDILVIGTGGSFSAFQAVNAAQAMGVDTDTTTR